MKFFTTIVSLIAVLGAVCGHGHGGVHVGGAVPVAPCPKNYVISCQPSLAPVPCARVPASYGGAHAGSYASVGAYSENVPTVINAPPTHHYQGPASNYLQTPYYYIKN